MKIKIGQGCSIAVECFLTTSETLGLIPRTRSRDEGWRGESKCYPESGSCAVISQRTGPRIGVSSEEQRANILERWRSLQPSLAT